MECRSLNGHDVDVPITLTGHFSPRTGGIQIDAVTLTVPELPIAEVELDALVGSRVRSGSFAGEVRYAEDGPDQTIRLRGRCSNLDLAEWTAGIAGHPWRGRGVEIALHELVVRNGAPLRLHFAGVLGDIGLADLLATWDLPPADGLVDLRVEDAVVSPAGIERFIAGGRCADLALEPLTGELGWGRMSGAADVLIEDLTVKFNRLSSFDGHLRVDPASGPLWIEGRLLTTLAEKLLAFRIPWQLPPRIPYTELGLTLEVRDEVLHIFGSHGPREKQILTVELVGQPVPLIREPEQSIDLRGWFDQLRAAGRAALEQHLLDLLREERNLEGDDGD
jgi:hypothetical protein